MLAKDEEFMLAKRWTEHQDPEAAHRLVTSHLRLVAKIAMGYRGYGLPIGEVISEGNVGLMQAVKKFDPDKGFRLATYAMWWIRASIQEYILRSLVAREDGHHGRAEEAVLQPAQASRAKSPLFEEGDLRPEQLSAEISTPPWRVRKKKSPIDEPPDGVGRRCLAQRADRRHGRREPSGRTGSPTTPPVSQAERIWPKAMMSSTTRMSLLRAKRWNRTQRNAKRHIITERRLKEDPDHAGRPGRLSTACQPRAHPPDRGPRLRETAKGHAGCGRRAEPGRRLIPGPGDPDGSPGLRSPPQRSDSAGPASFRHPESRPAPRPHPRRRPAAHRAARSRTGSRPDCGNRR